jgi:hypothetical protein
MLLNILQNRCFFLGGGGISYDRLVYKSYMYASRHYQAYALVTIRKVRCKSETRMHIVSCVCSYLQESPVEIQTPTRWKLIGRSMCYRPAVFFRNLRHLRFYSSKENFDAFIKCRLAHRINLFHLADRKSPGGEKMTFVR